MGSQKGKKWRKGHLQPEELGGGCRGSQPGSPQGLQQEQWRGPGDPGLARCPEAASVQGTNRGQDGQSQAAAGAGTGALRSGAGCPPTGLNPKKGRARGRGPGVEREGPGCPSPHTGRTDSQRGLDQLWLVPTQQESQVHQTGHGGLADPAETRRG